MGLGDARSSHTGRLFDGAASGWAARYESRRSLVARHRIVGHALRGELRAQDSWAGVRVLDFGCGPGVFAAAASDLAERVVCIDSSAAMLDAGERDRAVLGRLTQRLGGVYRPERIERIVGDEATLVELEPSSFNVILAIAVLEYIADPLAAIREFLRCLVPRGLLLLTLPNDESLVRRVEPPINAASNWVGSRVGVRRLAERACAGRGLDISHGVPAAGGVIVEKVALPLALNGVLSRARPNHLFRVRRRPD